MSSVAAFHFWSPTCEPCKAIKPAVEALKEDFPNVEWRSINTKDDPENFAAKFNVRMVPTIVVLKKGTDGIFHTVGSHTGAQMAQYYRLLRTATS